jgi:hypothetical protein
MKDLMKGTGIPLQQPSQRFCSTHSYLFYRNQLGYLPLKSMFEEFFSYLYYLRGSQDEALTSLILVSKKTPN